MRYDTPIFFQHITPGEFDAKTGNYEEDTIREVKKFASVKDSGAETLNLIYGGIKFGVKTISLQTPYAEPFDRIRINRKVYRVDFTRIPQTKQIFVASEVE